MFRNVLIGIDGQSDGRDASLRRSGRRGRRPVSSHELERVRIGWRAALDDGLGAFRLLRRRALISPERLFLYRPVTVAEAFERGEALFDLGPSRRSIPTTASL